MPEVISIFDAGDYDGSGRQGIVIGNFTNESMALYRNDGSGLFTDEAPTSGIGKMSAQSLTFAVFFFDYDLDGLLDIFAANGHVSDDISVVQPNVKYAQPPHLFRNKGKRKFEEMSAKLGRAMELAKESGHSDTAKLLAEVIDIDGIGGCCGSPIRLPTMRTPSACGSSTSTTTYGPCSASAGCTGCQTRSWL